MSVQTLQSGGYGNLASHYDDETNSGTAYVQVSASDPAFANSTYVALYAEKTQNGTTDSAYAYLYPTHMVVVGSLYASNMEHGTTDETSSIASGGDYTFSINFGKTFPSVPSVVCSLVDVKNGSGGAVDAHQVVASVSTITTTSCKIKIHNNGTQARKCKISWIAMSD